MFTMQRSPARFRRIGFQPVVGMTLLLAATGLFAPMARAQGQPTTLQRLRAMLGIIQPVSVGGSRGNSDKLCILSPWLQPGALALTPSGTPPIATSVPLDEVQILRGTTLLWRGRASSTGPLANPLAWPLPPLHPGESVLLKLRKQGADGADFSSVELRRPQASASASPAAAGADPSQALLALVQQGRKAEAMEALFQADLAGNPQLRQWARDTITTGCSASAPR